MDYIDKNLKFDSFKMKKNRKQFYLLDVMVLLVSMLRISF